MRQGALVHKLVVQIILQDALVKNAKVISNQSRNTAMKEDVFLTIEELSLLEATDVKGGMEGIVVNQTGCSNNVNVCGRNPYVSQTGCTNNASGCAC